MIKRVKDMDPRMGLCVDVGHTVRTGADILEEIDGAWDRIYDFHVKDLTDFTSKESRVDVGDGKMPIAAIFKMLKERKYQGVVGLELRSGCGPSAAGHGEVVFVHAWRAGTGRPDRFLRGWRRPYLLGRGAPLDGGAGCPQPLAAPR